MLATEIETVMVAAIVTVEVVTEAVTEVVTLADVEEVPKGSEVIEEPTEVVVEAKDAEILPADEPLIG